MKSVQISPPGRYVVIHDLEGDGVTRLLQLQATMFTYGHGFDWHINTTGGGMFIGFVPEADWPEFEKLLKELP